MATNLTLDQMKQLVRSHFDDFVNKRNAAVIHKNMTPDFYDHDRPASKPTDAKGDEQMMTAMYKSMPDLRLTIEDMIAEGNKWSAAISGAGQTPHRARRCSSTGLYCGALRGTKSQNAGPR